MRILLLISLLFLLGCVQPSNTNSTPLPPVDYPSVCIEEKCVQVRLAETPAERQRGLMGVASLTDEEGMLFLWGEQGIYPFWMKDTLIPLDIIWIQEDGTITEITTLQPCETEFCPVHTPKGIARYVLEVNAGLMQKWNVQEGMRARILLNETQTQATQAWN